MRRLPRSLRWLFTLGVILFVNHQGPEVGSRLSEAGGTGAREENSIQLIVDGVLRKTWTVGELMRAKFYWESPKKKAYPAVPLTFIFQSPPSAVQIGSLASMRVVSWKGEQIDLKGPAVSHLKDLILTLDVDKGGRWKLVGRNRKVEDALQAILGRRPVLSRVSRVELATSPEKKPSR